VLTVISYGAGILSSNVATYLSLRLYRPVDARPTAFPFDFQWRGICVDVNGLDLVHLGTHV